MDQALKWIDEGFYQELQSIVRDDDELQWALGKLQDDDALALGRRGAREALAPLVWRVLAGDVFETTQVTELLDVTRQAVNKRVRNHSLLALPGRGITYFPVWQFDLERRAVRPVIKEVLDCFYEALEEVDPLQIVSWSRSPQHEELKGMTPQDWINQGGSDDVVRIAAQRAAAALAV